MKPQLVGRRALITGGSKGIGLAIAQRFAQHGASVCLMARNSQQLDKALNTLPVLDGMTQTHSTLVHDVSTKHTQLPSADILVNSAGITQSSLLHSSKYEDIKQLVDTNLLGTITTTQSLIRSLLRSRKGSVINISSVLAKDQRLKGVSVYSASKAAVEAFTLAMASELDSKIRFNCLRLGLVDTDMGKSVSPQVREHLTQSIVSLDEVADAALELTLGDFNGRIMTLDGGYLKQ